MQVETNGKDGPGEVTTMSLMRRTAGLLGATAIGFGIQGGASALAHDDYGYGYGSGYRPAYGYIPARGTAYRPSVPPPPIPGEVCDARPQPQGGNCVDVRDVLSQYDPRSPYSPAEQLGNRPGQLYVETGYAPRRALTPVEAQGFVANRFRPSSIPHHFDEARRAGWREGVRFLETGRLPHHRLSPAEAEGFRAALQHATRR